MSQTAPPSSNGPPRGPAAGPAREQSAAKARRPARRTLVAALACVLAAEMAALAYFVWPLVPAKLRATPERLRTDTPAARPAEWAKPVAVGGLQNAHRVNADLYRGARPTAEGLRNLKALGVRTVVNLEWLHSDDEALKGTDLNYVHFRFQAWRPERKDMVGFLRVMGDANLAPVYVHCLHGSDRTGTMCAIYRIAVQGWSKPAAIDEMVHGGYGFHAEWQNLLEFLDGLDANDLRREAGVSL